MVRQACICGMWEGEFTEEVEWMSWVLEDQGVGGRAEMGQGTEVVKACLRHFSLSKRIRGDRMCKGFLIPLY